VDSIKSMAVDVPLVGADDFDFLPLQQRRQGENVAGVVVDDQGLCGRAAFRSKAVQPIEASAASPRKIVDDPMQEQGCFVRAAARSDCTSLKNDALGDRLDLVLFFHRQLFAGEDTTADRAGRVPPGSSRQVETGHVGEPQVEHDAVVFLLASVLAIASAPVPTAVSSMSS